jgi:hypothetical protein
MNKSEVELFPAAQTERYRTEWRAVQANFVDDPEAAVRAADKLVEQAMDTITDQLTQRRTELTASNGNGERTEQLRVALRRYRSMFGQLTGLANTDNGRQQPTVNPPVTDDPQRVVPPMKSPDVQRADASKPSVDGGDELVEHGGDVPDTER